MKYKKALVTGAAGFIGSHMCDKLIQEGIDVIGIDDLSAGKKKNIEHLKKNKKFKFKNIDVTNKNDLVNLFKEHNFDVVYHLAASKKNICLKDPVRDLDVNAGGTLKLLQVSKQFGVTRFVHVSTGSVYGEQMNKIYEYSVTKPLSFYGVSKLAGERYVRVYNKNKGMNTTIVRLFHVYGERQDASELGGVISIFIDRLYHGRIINVFGSGKQQRVFTYVQDVVNTLYQLSIKDRAIGEIYNVCANNTYTINLMIDKVVQTIKHHAPRLKKLTAYKRYQDWVEGDIIKFNISNYKLKCIGLNCDTKLDKGLDNTIQWYIKKEKE